jgi:hypothetical protein
MLPLLFVIGACVAILMIAVAVAPWRVRRATQRALQSPSASRRQAMININVDHHPALRQGSGKIYQGSDYEPTADDVGFTAAFEDACGHVIVHGFYSTVADTTFPTGTARIACASFETVNHANCLR